MKTFLKKLWDNFELYIMVALLICLLLVVFANIVGRTIGYPLRWGEEVSRILFIWLVFFGISYATLYESHIRVTFIAEAIFKGKSRYVLEIIIYLFTLAIFFWVMVKGIKYIDYCSIARTPALQLPRSWFVTILPITGFLTVIRSIYKIYESVLKLIGKDKKEGSK